MMRKVSRFVVGTVALIVDAFNEKANPLVDQALKRDEESNQIGTQAAKLQAAHQDKFG